MINPNVLMHLRGHAERYDCAAGLMQQSNRASAPALTACYRQCAADLRHLVALAELEDELLAGVADTLAEQLLAGEGQ